MAGMMKAMATRAALVVALGAMSCRAAENWPQFRGEGGRGISLHAAPREWDRATNHNIRWHADVAGLGHASPIVWNGRVYIATAVNPAGKPQLKLGVYGSGDSYSEKEPHQWRLLCFDAATGSRLFDKLALESVPREPRHTKASHCNSTPATDGRRLVAIFGSEGLFCFDMEGRLLWRKDLGAMDAGPWDAPSFHWSFAASPVLHDGRVIVQCDVMSEQYLAAFDVADGRLLWRTPRREVANWCTPAVDAASGQIVVNGWKQIAGYDLSEGKLLWELHGGGDIPVPAPVVINGVAYLTSGHGKYRPIRAVRLSARGDVTPPELEMTNAAVAWVHPKLGSYMQTPIVLGDLLWSCDWYGVVTCIDVATGVIRYSERLSAGHTFTASPVAAGKSLYFTSEEGDAFVVDASPKFSVTATNHFAGSVLATPAAADGALFFRTTEELICIAGPH
jgi:outer membrane protein assembly factor BamB